MFLEFFFFGFNVGSHSTFQSFTSLKWLWGVLQSIFPQESLREPVVGSCGERLVGYFCGKMGMCGMEKAVGYK